MGVVKARKHTSDVFVSLVVVLSAINAAETDIRRCLEKFFELRNGVQFCFIHVDHHFWMINLLAIGRLNLPRWAHFWVEIRKPFRLIPHWKRLPLAIYQVLR